MRFIYLIILINISAFAFSQPTNKKKSNKSLGLGLHTSYSYDSRVPDLSLSPSIIYATNKHQVQAGLDIYQKNTPLKTNNIIGAHACYNYFLLSETNKFNVFIDFNAQYVQYGLGIIGAMNYNYINFEDIEKASYNLVRTKSFINTLGIGISQQFLKKFTFNFVLSGGYNYYQSSVSPSATYSFYPGKIVGIDGFDVSEKAEPIFYSRIAITYKLWKNY